MAANTRAKNVIIVLGVIAMLVGISFAIYFSVKKDTCMQDRLGNCVLCPPGYKTQLTDEEYAKTVFGNKYGLINGSEYLDCDPKTKHCNNCYGTEWALPSTNCSSKDKTKCGDKIPWNSLMWKDPIQPSGKYSGPICPQHFRLMLVGGVYTATAVKTC